MQAALVNNANVSIEDTTSVFVSKLEQIYSQFRRNEVLKHELYDDVVENRD